MTTDLYPHCDKKLIVNRLGCKKYSEEGYFALLPLEVENPNYITYTGQDKLNISSNNLSFLFFKKI